MKLNLDVDSLTFGDMEDFEQVTGAPLMETLGKIDVKSGDMSSIRAKDIVALVWICARTENPEFTYEDARKVRLHDLEFTAPPVDPTDGGS